MRSDVSPSARTTTSDRSARNARIARIIPPSLPWQYPTAHVVGAEANSPAAAVKRSTARSTSRASTSRRSPAGVNATCRLVRSNSSSPSACSSSRMRCDNGGVVTCSRAAARPKWRSSATATK